MKHHIEKNLLQYIEAEQEQIFGEQWKINNDFSIKKNEIYIFEIIGEQSIDDTVAVHRFAVPLPLEKDIHISKDTIKQKKFSRLALSPAKGISIQNKNYIFFGFIRTFFISAHPIPLRMIDNNNMPTKSFGESISYEINISLHFNLKSYPRT